MVARFRSLWLKRKKQRVVIGVIVIVLAADILIGRILYWTGFRGESLWNWLRLLAFLAISFVLGLGAAWFTAKQSQRGRSSWQETRKSPAFFGFIALLMVVIALIFVEVELYGTGFAGKTLWDWLQLFIIPAVLAVGGYAINLTISRSEQEATSQRAKTEHEIALDNQRETALQVYLDKMSELLLEKHLRESQPEDEARKIARVRTLTVLHRLDSPRKRNVFQFLYESGLMDKDKRIVDLKGTELKGANLRDVDFRGADLRGVNLYKTNLSGADLEEADLRRVNLMEADLDGANLSGADLSGAKLYRAYLVDVNMGNTDLHGADLCGAALTRAYMGGADLSGTDLHGATMIETKLIGANLSGADLSGAHVATEQLNKVKSLLGATMPDGSIHP